MSSSTAAGFLTHSNAPFRSSIAAFTFPSHNCPSSSFFNARRRSLRPPPNSSIHNIVSEGATSTRSSLGEKSPGSQTRLESMRHRRPGPATGARRREPPTRVTAPKIATTGPPPCLPRMRSRNPATSTTAVNVHTSLRPVDGWALVLTSSGSTIMSPSSTSRGWSLATGNAGSHPGNPVAIHSAWTRSHSSWASSESSSGRSSSTNPVRASGSATAGPSKANWASDAPSRTARPRSRCADQLLALLMHDVDDRAEPQQVLIPGVAADLGTALARGSIVN